MGILEKLNRQHPAAPKKQKGLLRQFAESEVNSLPLQGGMLGGGIGGIAGAAAGGVGAVPGAVGGAALGGFGGEALKQLGSRALGMEAPQSPAEALSRIQKSGFEQGAYESVPPIVQAGAKGAGKALMQSVRDLTPEMAQTALQEGIRATRLGFKKAEAKIYEISGATKRLLDAHTRAGVRFDPNRDIVQGAIQDVMPYAQHGMNPGGPMGAAAAVDEGVPATGGDAQKVLDMAKKWLEGRSKPTSPGVYAVPSEITPSQMLKDRQAAETMARTLYDERGNKIAPTLEQRFAKAVADRIRGHLNGLTGVKPLNERASSLIDLKEALWPVAKKDKKFLARMAGRSLPVLAGGVAGSFTPGGPVEHIGGGLAGAALGAGLGSPSAASSLALALQGPQSPLLQMLLSQTPRLIGQGFQPAPPTR